jgi:hypothetical protein
MWWRRGEAEKIGMPPPPPPLPSYGWPYYFPERWMGFTARELGNMRHFMMKHGLTDDNLDRVEKVVIRPQTQEERLAALEAKVKRLEAR